MSKKYIYLILTLLIILISICVLYARQIIQPAGIYVNENRNTDGTLTFTVRTVSYNGNYAPNNSGAIWITNASNQFIKTIKVWAIPYRYTLVKWIASSQNNTTGAITGASLTSHQTHTITWNGTNASNTQVADGDYKVNIEFTEHNATTNNPGKYKTITFTKSSEPIDVMPANDTYFRDMHLVWTPTPPANGSITGIVKNSQNEAISGAQIVVGENIANTNTNGTYTIDLAPGVYNISCSATNYITQTITNVPITSNQTVTQNFTMISSVANADNELSKPLLSLQNYPNPFTNSTTIKYYVNKSSNSSLHIYNTKGQLVKNYSLGKTHGWNEVVWNGLDNKGKRLSSGKYICKLASDGATKTITISLQR
jgi:flagellar hook assembly protein FlgD